ncbi:MAG TPA: 1-deoxy-D-xylulose-5-phosphate reductoisomerase [Clostridiales bacterium]|jgi:1-deoxy-D-xylulose-5-phosphate reductoisomerase|nr:1-deoxy-D-xylulose-5-phosphate reductoisomerase [Clostridiales bacterium]
MRRLAVLGSSGTIGTYVLNVVRKYPQKFKIKSLCVYNNIQNLISSAWEFMPQAVGVSDSNIDYNYLKEQLPPYTKIYIGQQALEQTIDSDDIDFVVAASSGIASLKAVMLGINQGKTIALANKEVLVSGGEIIMKAAKKNQILPIDSEHSAILQCLQKEDAKSVKRIILTASGGAFFGKSKNEMKDITPKQALEHPNWSMGKKITVDSATMMNKGLEIIEAKHLFQKDNVDYVIHPQSIVHSMVEFADNSIIAQAANPSMEIPVLYALSYPERLLSEVEPLDFGNMSLSFFAPDEVNFPFPKLARFAYNKGGLTPAVMVAADQKAVELFLDKKIRFLDIYELVEYCVTNLTYNDNITIENILTVENTVREYLEKDYNKIIKHS